jgi:hypothetical protein
MQDEMPFLTIWNKGLNALIVTMILWFFNLQAFEWGMMLNVIHYQQNMDIGEIMYNECNKVQATHSVFSSKATHK